MTKSILLAEDSLDDADLLKRTLRLAKVLNPVFHVGDGEKAIAYLKGDGVYADRQTFPYPSVLLLDLKLPRMDGFQVLDWCQRHINPRELLIVALTGQDDLALARQSYHLGARSFLFKPATVEEVSNLIEAFPDYWTRNTPPGRLGLIRMLP